MRSEFYEEIKETLDVTKHNHYVSYDDADVEIVVEVFRDMLVFACLPGYKAINKKYNM